MAEANFESRRGFPSIFPCMARCYTSRHFLATIQVKAINDKKQNSKLIIKAAASTLEIELMSALIKFFEDLHAVIIAGNKI